MALFDYPFFIPFSFPHLSGCRCFFSTALAGNFSYTAEKTDAGHHRVTQSKQNFLDRFNLQSWGEVYQVHGNDLVETPEHFDISQPPLIKADGLYTTRQKYALTIRTADCQPILFVHTKGRFIAAIHAGWRGNSINYPGQAVEQLCRVYNVMPDTLMAVRGPSLGPGTAEFIHFHQEWPEGFTKWFDEHHRTMNLWQLTRDQLKAAGIPDSQIYSLDLCTHSLPHLFFSHRQKATGRQTAIIWLE